MAVKHKAIHASDKSLASPSQGVGVSDVSDQGARRRKTVRTNGVTLKQALLLLGVTPAQILEVSRIERLFRGIGGKAEVFKYLDGSEDPKARKIMALRRKLTADQSRVVPFEALCIAAKISTKDAFGLIAEEVFDQSQKAAYLLRDAKLRKILEATVDQAMTPAGVQEKRMLLQSGGVLPLPKTLVVPVHGNVNVDARDQRQVHQTAVLPPVERDVQRLSDRFLALPEFAESHDDEQDDDEQDDSEAE